MTTQTADSELKARHRTMWASGDYPQMVAGAILVAALALGIEGLMELIQRRVDPLRAARSTGVPPAGESPPVIQA